MSGKLKNIKFRSRYDSFLSDASNEEIVSISKELTEEMSAQVRLINSTGLGLVGISLLALVLSIMIFSLSESTFSGMSRSVILICRILALLLVAVSTVFAGLAISKAINASSVSTMFWRNVRETADDEKVYEQMIAIRALNVLISTSKNNLKSSVMFLVAGGLLVGVAYLYEILLSAGYL